MTDFESTPRTDRAPGASLPPIPGEAAARHFQDATESAVDEGGDFETNELHATGQPCARCGHPFRPDEVVRRTATGLYQHEACPWK